MKAKLDGGIQHILYCIVIIEKKTTVQDIADRLNIDPRTIYDYLERKPIIPLTLIKTVFELTLDPRLRDVLQPAGYVLVPATESRPCSGDWEKEIGDISISLGSFHGAVRLALDPESDGGSTITKKEATPIRAELDRMEREIADTRALLKRAESAATVRPLRTA
jgi:AcrR family transcriptional regulator